MSQVTQMLFLDEDIRNVRVRRRSPDGLTLVYA